MCYIVYMPTGIYKHKPFTEEVKKKLSFLKKGKPRLSYRGKNHPNWKGGIYKHPDYKRLHNLKREFIKKGTPKEIILTLKEWLEIKEKYDFKCLDCGKREPDIKITIDHIVPISKFGLHTKDNVQPLCMKCNHRKYNRTIDYRNPPRQRDVEDS